MERCAKKTYKEEEEEEEEQRLSEKSGRVWALALICSIVSTKKRCAVEHCHEYNDHLMQRRKGEGRREEKKKRGVSFLLLVPCCY
jgi:hypothetical protein